MTAINLRCLNFMPYIIYQLIQYTSAKANTANDFATNQTAQAACYGTLIVDQTNYGCSDAYPWYDEPVEGITVSIDNRKITLNNYNGGPIGITARDYSFDGNYEIELIGHNIIKAGSPNELYDSSQSTSSKNQDYSVAFYNITPTFTGSGTLEIINATTPFDYDYDGTYYFSITIVGSDYSKQLIEGSSDDISDDEPLVTIGAQTTSNEKSQTEPSFFETTLGLAVLIAVPTILVIIIIILSIALCKKNKENNAPTPTNILKKSVSPLKKENV